MGKVLVIKGANFSTNKVDTIIIGNTVNVSVSNTGTGSGTIQGVGDYSEGAEVTLVAKPANGCYFNGWSDLTGGAKYNPTRTITASTDVSLSCVFSSIEVRKGYATGTTGNNGGIEIYDTLQTRARTPQLFGRYTIECAPGYLLRAIAYYRPSLDTEDSNVLNHMNTVEYHGGDNSTTIRGKSRYTVPSAHANDYSIVTFQNAAGDSLEISSSEYGDVVGSLTYL